MPRLIAALVRHGDYQQLPDTPSALQPFPLTDEGQRQSEEAASILLTMLNNCKCALAPEVDSSNLLRAWETASIMIEQMQATSPAHLFLSGHDALAERSLGSAANLSVQQIEAIMQTDPRFDEPPENWKSNSHYRLPLQGAESLLEAGARVAEHLRKRMQTLAQSVEVDTLKLFVGHGAAFRHAAYHLGVLEIEQIAGLSMFHAQPVLLEYHTAQQWQHIDGDWKQRNGNSSFND